MLPYYLNVGQWSGLMYPVWRRSSDIVHVGGSCHISQMESISNVQIIERVMEPINAQADSKDAYVKSRILLTFYFL